MKFLAAILSFWLALALAVQAVNPAMPVIPSAVFNVTDYGAVGDGVTDSTTSIQNTINAASSAGGGTVEIPAGTYLSGPITLFSSIRLQIDANALLQMLSLGTYPGGATNAQTFITCNQVTDLEISGQGTIDGQGLPWWNYNATNNTIVRPMIMNLFNVNRLFIHDLTVQNSPGHQCGVRDFCGNVTISNLTINAPGNSPNTDGIDFTATNSIIENCHISDGDDNLAIGSTGPVNDLLITNCFFGTGHGVSVLGPTAPMSNMTVINCAFNGTGNGIRWKCNMDSSAPVQNINYFNITMTNVNLPIVMYCYYNETGTPDHITPSTVLAASNTAPVNATTPVWSNIIISNLTVASSGDIGGVIWGPTEWPISNLTLICVTNTAPKTFDLYNVQGVKIINSRFNFTSGNTFTLCNGGLTLSNTTANGHAVTIGGAASTNSLALYNNPASITSTDLFAANPLTIGSCVLTNFGNLVLSNNEAMNFLLGTNPSTVAVTGNLNLNGTINLTNGAGFTSNSYTLFTYTGSLSGAPLIGAVPDGYACTLNTSTNGQVVVTATFTGKFATVTSNALSSSINPSTFGTPPTFTATVSPPPTNGESVTFVDSTTTLGSGLLTNGVAVFKPAANQLAAGFHFINAVYSGDGAFKSSSSPVLTQIIDPPPGVFFNDTFGASTVDSNAPAAPTKNSTSYEILSSKAWVPTPNLTAGRLTFGIGSTSSGVIELQSLFAATPIRLEAAGDFVQLKVTFTNTAGILSQSGFWSFGLYDAGGVLPVPGGLNGGLSSSSSGSSTGFAQNWQGYVAQTSFASATSAFYDREQQTDLGTNNDQDLITVGNSSSYKNPAGVMIGTSSTTLSTPLTVGGQYTEILTYTLTSSNALQLQSQLYTGGDASGTLMATMTAFTGTTPLTTQFDGLAFGWRATGSTPSTMTVSSINVSAQITPPVINSGIYTNAGQNEPYIQFSWPYGYIGWMVQSNAGTLSAPNWITLSNTASATGYQINLPAPGPYGFFRLISGRNSSP